MTEAEVTSEYTVLFDGVGLLKRDNAPGSRRNRATDTNATPTIAHRRPEQNLRGAEASGQQWPHSADQ